MKENESTPPEVMILGEKFLDIFIEARDKKYPLRVVLNGLASAVSVFILATMEGKERDAILDYLVFLIKENPYWKKSFAEIDKETEEPDSEVI